MSDTTVDTEGAAWKDGDPGALTLEELESRVQRLEDVVATLCDTKGMEERLRVRVAEQVRAEVDRPAPKTPALPPDMGIQGPTADGVLGESQGLPSETPPAPAWSPAVPRKSFLLQEVWWDIASLFQMVRDPLFRMSWTSILVPILVLVYLIWSAASGFPRDLQPLGPVLDVAATFVVAYLFFKALGREIRRYRDFTGGWNH